jgi:hypothetical protein
MAAGDDVEKAQPPAPSPSSPHVQPLSQQQQQQQSSSSPSEHPTPQDASHLSSTRLLLVTTSLCLAAVLYGLDMNVITTQFHSLDDIAWYSAAYLLAITAFQPAFGNVYKYFPAKRVFGGSVFVFEGTYF